MAVGDHVTCRPYANYSFRPGSRLPILSSIMTAYFEFVFEFDYFILVFPCSTCDCIIYCNCQFKCLRLLSMQGAVEAYYGTTAYVSSHLSSTVFKRRDGLDAVLNGKKPWLLQYFVFWMIVDIFNSYVCMHSTTHLPNHSFPLTGRPNRTEFIMIYIAIIAMLRLCITWPWPGPWLLNSIQIRNLKLLALLAMLA